MSGSEPDQLKLRTRTVNRMTDLNIELALKIIPEYDGSPTTLHRFISCCEIIQKPLKSEENANLINLLKVKLTGKAYDVLRYKDFKTFRELKSEFQKQFGETRSSAQIQLELLQNSQSRNENVKSYANRIQQLLTELNECCSNSLGKSNDDILTLNDQTALKAFQEGLVPSIKLIVKACRFTKLKDAVAFAFEEETNLQSKSNSNTTPSYHKPIIKCQVCHKPGHNADVCFLRYRVNNPNSYSKAHNNIRVICAYCKNIGHHIQECRKRQNKQNHSNTYQKETTSPHFVQHSTREPNSENSIKLENLPGGSRA